MIRQCAILFGCLALGELIVFFTGIKLPSSIIGMLLLTLFLKLGWIKLHWVQGMSDFLVANLGFFFVPPGVALMLYFDVIASEFWRIVTASINQHPAGDCSYRMGSSTNTSKSNELFRKRIFPIGCHLRDFLLAKLLQKKTGMHVAEPHPADNCHPHCLPEDDTYQL